MKVIIQKIVRPFDLGEKAPELSGQKIYVWINPTLAFMKERDEIFLEFARKQKELRDAETKKVENLAELNAQFNAWLDGDFTDKNNAWFAHLWSQNEKQETHWTAAEVDELRNADPALLDWMKAHSVDMILEYRKAEKKS